MKRKPDHRYDETGKVFFGVLIYLFVFVYGMRDIYRRSTIETISYIICMGSGWCLIPCANFLQYRSYYKWIDCLDEWNPLYVRGYFRKQGVCQVFCVSFKKKIYGEGNLPLCIVSNFIRLLY